MPQTLDRLIEQEAAKAGATRASVRAAIERYAGDRDQASQAPQCSNVRKKEYRELAARAGRLLYYSNHYAPSGIFTPADRRLCDIAMRLPPQ